MKRCDDCRNYVWGDNVTPFPKVCIDCKYVEVNGEKEPSNWEPRPMTNADRIRAMSDEELADFVQRMIDVGDISEVYCTQKPKCFDLVDSADGIPEEWCRKCLLDWLRQPSEEEEKDA